MNAELSGAKYISVVTFRKDGREVATPLWVVTVDGKLCVYTPKTAGKVKRIRANGRVKVAPSDVRGRPLGAYSEGKARLVEDPAMAQRVFQAVGAKYGFLYSILNVLAKISGRTGNRVAIEMTF